MPSYSSTNRCARSVTQDGIASSASGELEYPRLCSIDFLFLLNCPWIKEKKKKIGIFVKRDTPRNVIVNRCYNKENLDALNISYRLFLRVNTFALSFYSKQKLITHRRIYCSTSTTI